MLSFKKKSVFGLRAIIISTVAVMAVSGCDQGGGRSAKKTVGADRAVFEKITKDKLASFDALYQLSLKEVRSNGGILSYDGMLILSWVDECDGYRTDQHLAANITNEDNDFILSEFSAMSWENPDQTRFQFLQVSKINKKTVKKITGVAHRDNEQVEGEIQLKQPEDTVFTLDKDVMFPTMLTAMLLDAAERGATHYEGYVYDGSDEYPKYKTVASIGKKSEFLGEAKAFEGAALLSGMSYWPVQLSYYAPNAVEGLPEFEISMNMFENGIGSQLVLDYGSFSVSGKLVDLQLLKQPGC